MAKRMTDTDKWKKGFMRGLPTKYKLLWLYILDDCNHAGVWEADFEVASLRVGGKVEEQEAINHFKDSIKIFDNGDKWFLPKFIDFQYGELNPNSRPHQAVIRIIEKYDLLNIEDTETSSVKTIIKVSNTSFKPPTLSEVNDYCIERKNSVNPNKFFNYYESNGWKVGRNKMKAWRSAVHTWESNSNDTNSDRTTSHKHKGGGDYGDGKF